MTLDTARTTYHTCPDCGSAWASGNAYTKVCIQGHSFRRADDGQLIVPDPPADRRNGRVPAATKGPSGLRPDRPWPEPPGDAAFRGLAGRVVDVVDPHTEADRIAIMATLLTMFSNAVGTDPHFMVGATRHAPRLYTALVGRTSKARKGDSLQPPKLLMTEADAEWGARVVSGSSSGEGLIWAVRDPVERDEELKDKGRRTGRFERVLVDAGVTDKRLQVIETELARVLRAIQRQGNTLSPVMRDAWDSGTLAILTKNNPVTAHGVHISIVAHITLDELRRELPDTEAANGLGNRFLWFLVKRSKELPEPEPLDDESLDELTILVKRALIAARAIGRMQRDPEARALWAQAYHNLSAERDGLVGALVARAEAQVLRLSMIYALLDGSALITVEHLTAALELWMYAERCVDYIFGDSTGDPVADTILSALRQRGELRRTEISDLFGRHQSSDRIATALMGLVTKGMAGFEQRQTSGRPVEIWRPA